MLIYVIGGLGHFSRPGELYSRLGRQDMDLLFAATALVHDMTLVTRNTRHFEPTGARLFNPYSS